MMRRDRETMSAGDGWPRTQPRTQEAADKTHGFGKLLATPRHRPAPAAVWPRQSCERLIAAYDDKYTAAAIFTAIIMI